MTETTIAAFAIFAIGFCLGLFVGCTRGETVTNFYECRRDEDEADEWKRGGE